MNFKERKITIEEVSTMIPAMFPFHRFMYLGVGGLHRESLASATLVYQFLANIISLFNIEAQCGGRGKKPIINMFGHPSPATSFIVCQVRSPLTQVLLTTVPSNDRLELYVWDPRKIPMGKKKRRMAARLVQHFFDRAGNGNFEGKRSTFSLGQA